MTLKDLNFVGAVGFFFFLLGLFGDAGGSVSLEDFAFFYPKASFLSCRLCFSGILSSFSFSSWSRFTSSTSNLPSCLVLKRFDWALFLWTGMTQWRVDGDQTPSFTSAEGSLSRAWHAFEHNFSIKWGKSFALWGCLT